MQDFNKEDFKYLEVMSKKLNINRFLLNDREHYNIDVEKTAFEIMSILSSKKLPVAVVDLIISRLNELLENYKILSTLETFELQKKIVSYCNN